MTDSEKLIKLAEWFDLKNPGEGDEVQQDLRRIAAQLSSKEQECEELKAKYAQLWGDWNSEQFSQTREENGNLRAENDRLKEKLNVWEEYVEVDIDMYQLRLKERDEARKRCEDLEAAIKIVCEGSEFMKKIFDKLLSQ